jgi:hypothetical protein
MGQRQISYDESRLNREVIHGLQSRILQAEEEIAKLRELSDSVTRAIDGKFVVKGGQIVKASSGEIVPEDEPLVLMRGRDHLMVATLNHYRRLCQLDGCNDYQLRLVDELIAKFTAYASDPSRMKQPGVTRGAAWKPADDASLSTSQENCGAISPGTGQYGGLTCNAHGVKRGGLGDGIEMHANESTGAAHTYFWAIEPTSQENEP